ncbi:MAG: hypothetical protein L0Y72_30485 [Gemmataceae bacterium]|nr:hypothetical protein [Gemmataceae bacterium]
MAGHIRLGALISALCVGVITPTVFAQQRILAEPRTDKVSHILDSVQAPTAEPKESKDDLMRLHAIIRPRKGEAIWSEIPWITDLWEARKKAAQEGKPIFVWSASADPLGTT